MGDHQHPGDCMCSECTADSFYEFWLDEEYIEARRDEEWLAQLAADGWRPPEGLT